MRIVTFYKCIVPVLFLLLSGCTSPNLTSWDQTIFNPAYWNRSLSEQQAEESRLQIEQSLTLENLEKAQKVIVYSRRESVSELLLADLYSEVSNRLLDAAEQEKKADRPDKAGRYYRMAYEIYPDDSYLRSTIRLSAAEINYNIEECADDLMEDGLAAYRSGDLDRAIIIWQGIGRFHPNHPPSVIATTTAKQQLKSLEMLTTERPL